MFKPLRKRREEEDNRNLLQAKSLNLEKIMNEKMSKRKETMSLTIH
jgi:hypothetical protein